MVYSIKLHGKINEHTKIKGNLLHEISTYLTRPSIPTTNCENVIEFFMCLLVLSLNSHTVTSVSIV